MNGALATNPFDEVKIRPLDLNKAFSDYFELKITLEMFYGLDFKNCRYGENNQK
jgi:hypothetical protein